MHTVLVFLAATAGAAVGRLIRLPFWALTGALVGAGAYHLVVAEPTRVHPGWGLGAQILVGTAVGSRVGRTVLRDFRAVLVPGTVAVVAIVGTGLGLGAAFTRLDDLDPVTAVFGMVPGGVAEMIAAANSLGGDGAIVAAMHLVRVLVVLSLLGLAVGRLPDIRDDGEP